MKEHNDITIGLFGTCDNIPWRIPFIERYKKEGMKWFNPDYGSEWHPGCIPEENYFLNNSEIILFPILKDSLGSGSLGEIGFSVQNVVRNIQNGKQQFLIVLIDDDCTDERKTDEERKRSIKDRKLVKSKIMEKLSYPVITIVDSLEEMLDLSIELYMFAKKGKTVNERSE